MGTVVVGIDGSEGSDAALRFALEEARLRRATLRVVHAYVLPLAEVAPDPFLLEFPSVPGPDLEAIAEDLDKGAASLIDAAVERALGGSEADVAIERVAFEGSPAASLIDEAEGAELLVVGSRGHGRVHGLLLGSVSQQCVSHAPCPVAIVPAT
jgi:nucleotide-binding universal stress UspA family protein